MSDPEALDAKATIKEHSPTMATRGRLREGAKTYYVYILASRRDGALYTGITSDLVKRVYEHRNDLASQFTKTYHVHRLVYYETTTDIASAITREKQIKAWKRAWKIQLIEKDNPKWRDLYSSLL